MTGAIVVVGAGLAGGSAALALREEGFEGRLVLVGEEGHPPYERPPLSKAYLRGESTAAALSRLVEIRPEHGVERRLGVRAVRLDADRRRIELSDGDSLGYERLLLATGARNRRLRVPGAGLDGIFELRTLEDADRIRAAAAAGGRAVVVGLGFVGCEVAASLRQLGAEVTAVEPFPVPLYRALGETVGGAVAAVHREHGVKLLLGQGVAGFEGGSRVERVIAGPGTRLGCDFAVVGVGVEPAVELAVAAGIRVEDGIMVDELCRTSAPDVFAAGDVANHLHPLYGRHLRVEHWQNAIHQGRAAARSMLGGTQPYDDVPWFWSDQYEHNLQSAGHPPGREPDALRGTVAERSFVAFYLEDGRLVAAVAMNRPRDLRRCLRLIAARVPVEAAKLRDESVDLRFLAGAHGVNAAPD